MENLKNDNSKTINYKKIRPDEKTFAPIKREKDADYDLFCSSQILIRVGQIMPVNTNVAIEFPDGWEGKIEDKSGLALKRGLHVLGGVIDNGYTGEILILVSNLGKSDVLFNPGEKVAQLQLRRSSPHFCFVEVERELKQTERGNRGFGSSGV